MAKRACEGGAALPEEKRARQEQELSDAAAAAAAAASALLAAVSQSSTAWTAPSQEQDSAAQAQLVESVAQAQLVDPLVVQAVQQHLAAAAAAEAAAASGAGRQAQAAVQVDWTTTLQPVEAEFYIEQSLIGWVIGTAGATVKSVEQAFQVTIAMDQATKSLGYSKLKIKGPAAMVQKAAEHINASLAVATASAHQGATEVGPFLTDVPPANAKPLPLTGDAGAWSKPVEEAMQIDQQWVGWLIGKGGGVTREIETLTGAKVSIDQSTKILGYSTVKVSGEPAAVELAKQRISASLERMLNSAHGDQGVLGGTSVKVRIEQQWVGWIVGKGGAVVKEIETATGAKLSMNQETKALGYSICTISGHAAAVAAASHQISDKLRQVNPNFQGLTPA